MIQFKNVTKIFGEKMVLEDINLTINDNELVCIVGPSGAGKSTLLHTLIGAIPPTTGIIQVNDFK